MINAMRRNGSRVSVVSIESLSEITSEIHDVPHLVHSFRKTSNTS